jgi:hypothetical protein
MPYPCSDSFLTEILRMALLPGTMVVLQHV